MKRTLLWALPLVLLVGGAAAAPGCATTDTVSGGGSGDEDDDGSLTGGDEDTSDTSNKSGDKDPGDVDDPTGAGGSSSTGQGGATTGAGGSSTGTEACCAEVETAGCTDDSMIEACVCAEDPFCCETAWDATCVGEVTSLSCGVCPSDPGGSSGSGGGSGGGGVPGDCCAANADAAGCTDMAVQDCVCAQDSYCCDTAWDDLCVEEVATFMCGSCMP